MDLGIRDRVALVTGASSGLGEAVALALASENVRLAVAARRRDRLENVAREARKRGAAEALAFEVDLAESTSIQRLIKDVRGALGDVDILVANGGGPKPGTYLDLSPADWGVRFRALLRSMPELI